MTSLYRLNIRTIFDKAINTVADVLLNTLRIKLHAKKQPPLHWSSEGFVMNALGFGAVYVAVCREKGSYWQD